MSREQGRITEESPSTGGMPTAFAKCVECGTVYPAQESKKGDYRPIGTNGGCKCGSEDFELAV